MRRVLLVPILLVWACGSSNGTQGSKDTSPQTDIRAEVGSDTQLDLDSTLPREDLVATDLSPADSTPDVFDLAQPDLAEDLPQSDVQEVWFDWLEDQTLKEGCGNAIMEDGEVCDGGGKPCKNMLMNFIGGTAYCKEDCTGWSTAGCITNGKPFCGNGIKEGLEACDGTSKACSELGSGWKSGTATCSFDCRTYAIEECTTDIAAYGYLDIDFNSPCILNDDMVGDVAYMQEHFSCMVQETSFQGTYAANLLPIPNPAGMEILSYALRDTQKDWLYVLQERFSMVNGAIVYHNPQIEMHFAYPELVPGDYPLNFQVMGATRLYLFNYKEDGSKCLLAVGIGGHVTVTLAEDTAESEGGKLAFEAQDVPIYYVTESPYGQALANSFQAVGICPKE